MSNTTQPLDPKSSYEDLFSDRLAQVEAALDCFLTPDGGNGALEIETPRVLWDALRYSTLNGGKRIRAILTLESCIACGGDLQTAMPTACAIEMVHAQSLIHDDLPCMDDDDLRRGKPTLHKKYDESTAVLAGDALLAMAYGVVTEHTPLSNTLSAERLITLLTRFSKSTSMHGLVNGQYVDIEFEGKPFDQKVLDYIHSNKTGALFTFSSEAGAMLSGVDDETVATFSRFGQKIGLAFQIVDDLLDIESNSDSMGKTVGKDLIQEKATYPSLIGAEASREKATQLIESALSELNSATIVTPERLTKLAEFIRTRLH